MDKEKKPNKATCGQGCVENEEHQHEEEVEMKPWQLVHGIPIIFPCLILETSRYFD